MGDDSVDRLSSKVAHWNPGPRLQSGSVLLTGCRAKSLIETIDSRMNTISVDRLSSKVAHWNFVFWRTFKINVDRLSSKVAHWNHPCEISFPAIRWQAVEQSRSLKLYCISVDQVTPLTGCRAKSLIETLQAIKRPTMIVDRLSSKVAHWNWVPPHGMDFPSRLTGCRAKSLIETVNNVLENSRASWQAVEQSRSLKLWKNQALTPMLFVDRLSSKVAHWN